MLNRVFIVIGLLVILAIGAAFVVPWLIPWNAYRDRMEAAAGAAIGAPVTIAGDIKFQLLPQPKLTFNQVAVGPPDAPVLSVDRVEAELSLLDFLRDRYRITHLKLDEPELKVAIDAGGHLVTALTAPAGSTSSNVSIEDATLSAGTLLIADARSSDMIRIDGLGGELKLPGPGAPLSFQGSGILGGGVYDLRFSSAGFDANGTTKLAIFAQRGDESTSLSAEGDLALGGAPKFTGDITLRRKPPAGNTDLVRGDLVVTSSIEAGLDKVLLSSYTIVPDENRAGTRLTGAAKLTLGPQAAFDAVISGGALALPPRDATAEDAVGPYELVRLLAEMPGPPVIGVPGRIGVDIAELNLRAVALRNVRFDAVSGASGWSLKNFSALLPGNSLLRLDGTLSTENERPIFAGDVSIETARLDALAQMWRKPQAPNPLFNVKASYAAKVALASDTLTLSEGKLVLDGQSHDLGATIGFGPTRRLDVRTDFGTLDPEGSAAVAALLPDFSSGGSFGITFPHGTVALTARTATVLGLAGQGLEADGSWEGGVFDIKRLSADDLGGAKFNLGLTVFGTAVHPELFGKGTVALAAAPSPALAMLLATLGAPDAMRQAIARSVPAALNVQLDPPGGDGSQILTISGTAGVGQLTAQAQLGAGLFRTIGAPLGLKLDVVSPDVAGLSAQLGLGDTGLLAPEGPMHLAATVQGPPSGILTTNVVLESGADSIGFSGTVAAGDLGKWTGSGSLKASLSDPSPLADDLGAGGIALPPVNGTAQLEFAGLESLKLTAIDAHSGDAAVTGDLGLVRQGSAGAVSGNLKIGGGVPLTAVAAALVGPAGLLAGDAGVWPDGPIAIGQGRRTTTGRVHIETPAITNGAAPLLKDVKFDLNWDADTVRVGDLSASLGNGGVTLDASVCCAGPSPQKTVTARIGLNGVDLTAVLPLGRKTGLGGTVSGAAQVQGTGESLTAAVATLAGDGSFTIKDFAVDGLAASAFADVAAMQNVADAQPDVLEGQINSALSAGAFTAPEVAGSFNVAGGVLRSDNLAVQGQDVRLFGGGTLKLADLSLDGAYTLTPVGSLGDGGFINETTAQVTARLGGTLLGPQRSFDVSGLVDAIQVHAYETELAELERLKAEDEARALAAKAARQAADEQAAVQAALGVVVASHELVLSASKAAGAAAQKAAEVEAANIAAAEVAAQKAAEAARKAQAAQAAAPPPQEPPAPTMSPLVLTPIEPDTRF